MPVLEAMASGLAVVSSACLGVATFCRHGDNCLLAGPNDVAGLAGHLLQVRRRPRGWLGARMRVALLLHPAPRARPADGGATARRASPQVLSDAPLRARLQQAGRATALQHSTAQVAEQLEAVLYSLAASASEQLQLRQAAAGSIQLASTWAAQACSGVR
jgi:glycosyltransferase involved in cell wall biosynthesis